MPLCTVKVYGIWATFKMRPFYTNGELAQHMAVRVLITFIHLSYSGENRIRDTAIAFQIFYSGVRDLELK